MKRKIAGSRLDSALFELQEAQSMLGEVHTANGARAVATAMQAPLDEILEIVESLWFGEGKGNHVDIAEREANHA